MTGPECLECPAPVNDRWRARLTGRGVASAAGIVGSVLVLAGCAASIRPGPVVDPAAPAPFTIADGQTPTQAQAQAAVDAAVRRDGLLGVFPRFSALESRRVPIRITLFACGSVGGYATRRTRLATIMSAICHVDVLDQNGGLVGRTTMRFARQQDAWGLIEDREREFDAR